jgi:AraC-like DNA-binding protein
MINDNILFKKIKPDNSITGFVGCFWKVDNQTGFDKKVVVLPDANFDLVISKTIGVPLFISLMSLNTRVDETIIKANTRIFLINFKLFAAEYLFQDTIANFINSYKKLPNNFWSIEENDLNDFDKFCKKMTLTIQQLLPTEIDRRKQKLSELLYSSVDSFTVKEISEQVFWSSRQINRYFTKHVGISLKEYMNILRFKASLRQIDQGKLFPEQNYFDQAHFSREVKKITGVNLRELYKNKNDRFIQVSLMGEE